MQHDDNYIYRLLWLNMLRNDNQQLQFKFEPINGEFRAH